MSKVVVVTGGSAGIGRAVARSFASRGDSVAVLARESSRLDETCRELEALGSPVLALPVDVADAEAVDEAAERIEAVLGPIDIWVNNAMVTMLAPVDRVTPEEYRRVTEVTYLGSVWGTMAALRYMKPRDRGVIVQVGSALAYRGIPLQAAYCGAKHALQGLCESLRAELPTRGEWRAGDDGPDPRRQHATVRVDALADGAAAATRGAGVLARAGGRRDRRRGQGNEVLVGWPTMLAAAWNALAPGAVDRYLAANGYDAQQEDGEELQPEQPDNLFEPVPLAVGAAGRFGDETHTRAVRVPAPLARGALVFSAVAAAAGLAVLGRVSKNGK